MSLPVRIIRRRREQNRRLRLEDVETPLVKGTPLSAASASLLVSAYPAAIDSSPLAGFIDDNTAPLSGIFHNFLALMLEATMAEIGLLPDMDTAGVTLLEWLGVESAQTISNWRGFDKPDSFGGGDEKGAIFGLIKKNHSTTAVIYSNAQNATATSHQGLHPALKQPALFAEVIGSGINASDMVGGIGGGVRGEVTGTVGVDYQYTYRGHPAGSSPGNPVGSFVQQVNMLLFFLVEAP